MRFIAFRNIVKAWLLLAGVCGVLAFAGWSIGGLRLLSIFVFCGLLLVIGAYWTFDRVVLRARSATPSYAVRYVRRIIADGSGNPVALRGTKRIRIVVRNARGHTQGGTNLLPGTRTPLCPNLRQLKTAGDFEGVVTLGLGLRRKTGFRVFRLTGPTRIVVDIAH